MTETIRVVVVDDDALVRAGLGLIRGGAPEIRVVGDAGDGDDGVALVRRERPDVVLMDIRMPRVDGIEATRQIVALAGGESRVIVLTTFDADDMVMRALRAGAAGFLLKDTPPERLVAAVRAAATGEPTFSPTVMAQIVERVAGGGAGGSGGPAGSGGAAAPDAARRAAAERMATFTAREREVAQVLARGLANAEIAAELYMSVPTVKTHVSRILEKLGAANRVQAAIAIHDAGLAP